MEQVKQELAELIRTSSSTDDVNAKLEEWKQASPTYGPLGDVLFVTTVMADLAGQLMVAGRESEIVRLAANDPPPKPFLDLPWADALNYFRKRGLVRETDFQTLLGDYAQRSAVARRLMLDNIQSEVMRHLDSAIEQGQTFQQFADNVDDLTDSLGLARGAPSYLQTVFRTNVQSAYGAGRYRAITNPTVRRARPFVQYRTAGDLRVRDEHAVLDGLTFASSDPTWHRISPPNGYNCRCSIVTLSSEQAAGLQIATEIPAGFKPTPGFDNPPSPELDLGEEEVS